MLRSTEWRRATGDGRFHHCSCSVVDCALRSSPPACQSQKALHLQAHATPHHRTDVAWPLWNLVNAVRIEPKFLLWSAPQGDNLGKHRTWRNYCFVEAYCKEQNVREELRVKSFHLATCWLAPTPYTCSNLFVNCSQAVSNPVPLL